MDTYVLKRYNSAAQYIAMRPILDLCNKTVWIPVTCVEKKVVGAGGNGPGGSSGDGHGGYRIGGGVGSYRGISGGSSREINHRKK